MAAQRNAVIDLFWKIHPKIYRWSSGRLLGSMMGMPVLLLTTTGRRSGLARTKALMFMARDEDFVVIASFLGSQQHPAWWLNLVSDPNATVEIGATKYAVHAREAEGEERGQLWQAVSENEPMYDDYQAQTSRRIPVVVLEKRVMLDTL